MWPISRQMFSKSCFITSMSVRYLQSKWKKWRLNCWPLPTSQIPTWKTQKGLWEISVVRYVTCKLYQIALAHGRKKSVVLLERESSGIHSSKSKSSDENDKLEKVSQEEADFCDVDHGNVAGNECRHLILIIWRRSYTKLLMQYRKCLLFFEHELRNVPICIRVTFVIQKYKLLTWNWFFLCFNI